MSSVARQLHHTSSLEALIREQISWRNVVQDLGQGKNTSFERQDLYKTVSGSFAALVRFLRQVTESESFRQMLPPSEGQFAARQQPRSPGVQKESTT